MATFTVPTTGVYTNARTGGRFKHIAGSVIDLALAVDLGMEGASLPAAGPPFNDAQVAYLASTFEGEGAFSLEGHTHAHETQARTATADGTGTGTISVPASGSVYVPVTSDDANKIIVLPTPTPGTVVEWYVGANGFELRSSAPATVGINSGTGVNAESAIPANTYGIARCSTTTNWVAHEIASNGVISTVEVAAP